MRCGEWKIVQMFQVTWPCPYKLWWKTSKIFSSEPWGQWLWNLVYSIGYSSTNNISYDDLGLTFLFSWQGQICFQMLLHGWKLIQHWVLMYFQVCSNSTYPQHSGEQYRTNGPLVLCKLTFFIFQNDSSSSSFVSSFHSNWWKEKPTKCMRNLQGLTYGFGKHLPGGKLGIISTCPFACQLAR